jgi:retinol dehydrogenase-12
VQGKVCLVTGATSGIGAVTAEALAQQGATAVIVGRDPAKCEAVAARIRQRTGNPSVGHLVADLSRQADVRELARQFLERYPRLDVLVNNAGGIFLSRRLSADGIEMTFALNHLGYFLLTTLLLDRICASAPSRIVNVASIGHKLAEGARFEDLQFERGYRAGFPAYHHSKLANLLFTYELARRLEGTSVTVNALHPGLVATNIGTNNGLSWQVLSFFYQRILRPNYVSPEEGARTIVYLASSPEVEGVTGCYFVDERAVPSSKASNDVDAARRLWDLSEELTASPASSRS